MRQSEILAVLGLLAVVLAAAEAAEERSGRRLRPAVGRRKYFCKSNTDGRTCHFKVYSRDELESIDLFLALLLRFAAAALAVSLALPVAVPLLVAFISGLFA